MGNFSSKTRKNIRLRLAERDGWVCQICKRTFETKSAQYSLPHLIPTIDHILPKSLGGKNNIANLRLAHSACNNKRGNSMFTEEYDYARTKGLPIAQTRLGRETIYGWIVDNGR